MVSMVITGAPSPLGTKVISSHLKKGYSILAFVRSISSLSYNQKTKKNVTWVEADLSKQKDIDNCVKIIENHFEPIWSFFHLASCSCKDDLDFDTLSETFSVNVFSAWIIASACIKKMTKGGRIVFIGSVGHKFGGKENQIGYGASKYLLEYFPKFLRVSKKNNILVNTIRVGVMDGATQQKTGVTKKMFEERQKLIPIERAASTDEVEKIISFVCNKDNSYMHLSVIPVTGGE